jgi:hypothetical protein
MDVIRPAAFSRLAAANAPNSEALTENLLSYGVAYGLALQGLGLSQITSNLVPTEIAKQVVWRRKTPWFYGSAAALLLSALIVWGRNIADAGAVTAGQGTDPRPIYTVQYAPDDKERKNPLPDPAALQVVNGTFRAQSSVGKAAEVKAAADHMREVLTLIANQNDALAAQAREMVSLEVNEAVWPQILLMIHRALPKPDAEMKDALEKGPEAVKKLVQGNPKYERGKRDEIYILNLISEYSPDVMTAFKDPGLDRAAGTPGTPGMSAMGTAGGADSSAPVQAGLPGFLVRFEIRSPNQGQFEYINRNFLSKLRAAAEPGVAYIADVRAPKRAQVKDGGVSDTSRAGIGRARGISGGVGALGGGIGTAIMTAETVEDPVTGEPMRDDWEYAGSMAVVLGDKPAAPAAPVAPDAGAGQPDAGAAQPGM